VYGRKDPPFSFYRGAIPVSFDHVEDKAYECFVNLVGLTKEQLPSSGVITYELLHEKANPNIPYVNPRFSDPEQVRHQQAHRNLIQKNVEKIRDIFEPFVPFKDELGADLDKRCVYITNKRGRGYQLVHARFIEERQAISLD
jgi:hypothetical protein